MNNNHSLEESKNLDNYQSSISEIIDISQFQNVKLKKYSNWFNVNLIFFITILGISLTINVVLLTLIF